MARSKPNRAERVRRRASRSAFLSAASSSPSAELARTAVDGVVRLASVCASNVSSATSSAQLATLRHLFAAGSSAIHSDLRSVSDSRLQSVAQREAQSRQSVGRRSLHPAVSSSRPGSWARIRSGSSCPSYSLFDLVEPRPLSEPV